MKKLLCVSLLASTLVAGAASANPADLATAFSPTGGNANSVINTFAAADKLGEPKELNVSFDNGDATKGSIRFANPISTKTFKQTCSDALTALQGNNATAGWTMNQATATECEFKNAAGIDTLVTSKGKMIEWKDKA